MKGLVEGSPQVSPDLAGVVAPDRAGGKILTMLALLRNTIHGAALDALGVSTSSRRAEEFLAGLPHPDAARLVEAMDDLGGREAWGVRELLPERFHAAPGMLLERTLVEVIRLLNDLMRLTPVERLRGRGACLDRCAPEGDDTFSEWNRLSIRWQLGL